MIGNVRNSVLNNQHFKYTKQLLYCRGTAIDHSKILN